MSVYDRANDPGRFQYAKEQLQRRGCRIMAMQNHCKVITALFADGTGYTAEGSANLRSHSTTRKCRVDQRPRAIRLSSGMDGGRACDSREGAQHGPGSRQAGPQRIFVSAAPASAS